MKEWFIKNMSKITLSLALIGATAGLTSLIIGSVSLNKTDGLTSFLDYDKKAMFGASTIWAYKVPSDHKIKLYFAVNAGNTAIKWDGKYPDGYFNKKL